MIRRMLPALVVALSMAVTHATADSVQLDVWPFALGRPIAVGPATVRFTLNPHRELVAQCTVDSGTTSDRVTVILLDDHNRIVEAASAPFDAHQSGRLAAAPLGDSAALGAATRFAVTGIGDAGGASGEARRLEFTPLRAGGAVTPVTTTDQGGKNRTTAVQLAASEQGEAVVRIDLASGDDWSEFQLAAVVAAFDVEGRFLGAASHSETVHVEGDAVEAKRRVVLAGVPADRVAGVAIGVARGATLSAPMGSLWGTFMRSMTPFTVEQLLAGDDEPCWAAGIDQLTAATIDSLNHGLWDGAHDWRDQIAAGSTPAAQLRPNAERLAAIAERAALPATRAGALVLLGYANSRGTARIAMELLGSPSPELADAAAICLGLLRRDEGLPRLEAILNRPTADDDDRASARTAYATKRHALTALATVRSDASAPVVARRLAAYVDGIALTNNKHSPVQGTRHDAETLVELLGALPAEHNIPALCDAIERLERRDDLHGEYGLAVFMAALLEHGPEVRPFVEARVRRGDPGTLYALKHSAGDPYYVSSVREMADAGASAGAWRSAIYYLWGVESPAASEALRIAYEHGVPRGVDGQCERLLAATALAARGDNRGLEPAFDVLAELQRQASAAPTVDDSGRPDADSDKSLEDVRAAALDVFERAADHAAVETLLVDRAQRTESSVRQATAAIAAAVRQPPAALKPTLQQWAGDDADVVLQRLADEALAQFR